MPWHVLLQLRMIHLKVAVLLSLATLTGLTALLGFYFADWRGALLCPLGVLSIFAMGLYLCLWLLSRLALSAHGRGHHKRALKILWLFQIPGLCRFDRRGELASAFEDCKREAGGELLGDAIQSVENFLCPGLLSALMRRRYVKPGKPPAGGS